MVTVPVRVEEYRRQRHHDAKRGNRGENYRRDTDPPIGTGDRDEYTENCCEDAGYGTERLDRHYIDILGRRDRTHLPNRRRNHKQTHWQKNRRRQHAAYSVMDCQEEPAVDSLVHHRRVEVSTTKPGSS